VHHSFWREHPALLLGLTLLIGIGFSLFAFPLWLTLLWALYLLFLRRFAFLLALLLAVLYAHFFSVPDLPDPLPCTARFSISAVHRHHSPFFKELHYRGTLTLNNLSFPCTVPLKTKPPPPATQDYQLTGTLRQRGPHDFLFKPTQWTPIPHTFSLAHLRHQTKEHFRSFLHSKLHLPRTATLLASLSTGEVEDRLLRYEFGRLGLQHILAISGFHFAILIQFFSLFLSLFLPHKPKWIALISLLTLYYLFIGSSPAVQRAWIISILFFLSKLLKQPTSPINLLGGALLIELLFNPLIASNLAFQLSFGCCFGILLLYSPIRKFLQPLFPKKPHLIPAFFHSSLSLTLAVNTAILPLLLLHFGRFPYLSLLYNLFFPFLISLSLLLLIPTLLLHLLVPTFAIPAFSLLDHYTASLLDLISHPPLLLDYSLYIQEIPYQLIPLYLFALLCLSLWLKRKDSYLFNY